MRVDHIELHQIDLPLVHPFRTSFGEQRRRPCILVSVHSGGHVGWGECVAMVGPWYSEETIETAWHLLSEFLAPMILQRDFEDPREIPAMMKTVRGNLMAKASLENAVWDLVGRQRKLSLATMLGGVRDRVAVGVSIGIQPTLAQLLDRVDSFVDAGYQRIKIKIEPGWEMEPVRRIRERHPDMMLMADANSAFSLEDADIFRRLDAFGLLMIEQPLAHDDIANHARLQAQIQTPLCLDESIHSVADVRAMIDLQAGRIINLKVGRVGGLTTATIMHDMARDAGLDMWCGGMLETGIGRAVNIQLASMPNFTLPGDISATERYYHQDIATPPFVLNQEDSTMTVPTGHGIGVEVDLERIEANRSRWLAIREPMLSHASGEARQVV